MNKLTQTALYAVGMMGNPIGSCKSDKILKKKYKNLPKSNFKITKHKRNKKTGY